METIIKVTPPESQSESEDSDEGKIFPGLEFGLLFDIDGVIARGSNVLPAAKRAFKRIVDENGNFIVQVVFVTNAGGATGVDKAKTLSDWLDVQIDEERVILSHSPFKMYRKYHNKNVLAIGQGNIVEIAKSVGFTQITTIKDLKEKFPVLDMVDHDLRKIPCKSIESEAATFKRIEAIVIFGEPKKWETSLQLLMDVLQTDGMPTKAIETVPYPHIPVLACNLDLQWMAEAPIPRFGNGAFLVCMESLYKKITGKDLVYTALLGKPSEITTVFAEQCMISEAKRTSMNTHIKRLYFVGDNPMVDIYASNLYNKFLSKRKKMPPRRMASWDQVIDEVTKTTRKRKSGVFSHEEVKNALLELSAEYNTFIDQCADTCVSILVETGVYDSRKEYLFEKTDAPNHAHRDIELDPLLNKPLYKVKDVDEAIQLIFSLENKTTFHLQV